MIRCIVARENVKSCSTYESRTRGRVKSVGIIGSKVCAPCTHDSSTHSQVSRQETTLVSAFSKFLCREHRTFVENKMKGKRTKEFSKIITVRKNSEDERKNSRSTDLKGDARKNYFSPSLVKIETRHPITVYTPREEEALEKSRRRPFITPLVTSTHSNTLENVGDSRHVSRGKDARNVCTTRQRSIETFLRRIERS